MLTPSELRTLAEAAEFSYRHWGIEAYEAVIPKAYAEADRLEETLDKSDPRAAMYDIGLVGSYLRPCYIIAPADPGKWVCVRFVKGKHQTVPVDSLWLWDEPAKLREGR